MDTYFATNDGQWVSEKYERLAQVIKDYEPSLELRWIPTDRRTREDNKPYVVWDTRGNYPVFFASELDTPEDILERLFLADGKNGNVLNRLEAHNAAVEALELRKKIDLYEELNDKAEFLITKRLNWTKMGRDEAGRLIKLDDQLRRI